MQMVNQGMKPRWPTLSVSFIQGKETGVKTAQGTGIDVQSRPSLLPASVVVISRVPCS